MKSFIFHTIANIWVGEQANLRILGFNVFDDSWGYLRCPNPRLQISVGDYALRNNSFVDIQHNSE
jgi:hypothetical protein